MSPLLSELYGRFLEVTSWGMSLERKDIPFAYPGGRRLPLYRQRGGGKGELNLALDATRLLAHRTGFLDQGTLTPGRIVAVENDLAAHDADYRAGQYLSLLRLAMDLVDTAASGITVIERRTLHLARRRFLEVQASERPLDSRGVLAFLGILERNDPRELGGLIDAFRLVQVSSRHPLIGYPHFASTRQLQIILNCCLVAASAPQRVPVSHVFLAARAVPASHSERPARIASLLDSSLAPGEEECLELCQWMTETCDLEEGHVFTVPAELLVSDFVSHNVTRSALDLVQGGVNRLLSSDRPSGTVLDAIERAFYRRIYKQEGAKYLQASRMEQFLAETLSHHLRRAMRRPHADAPGSSLPEAPTPALRDLSTYLERAGMLDRARAGGWTPSGSRAVSLLMVPLEPAEREELKKIWNHLGSLFLAGSEELVRFLTGCRGNLDEELSARPPELRRRLALWLHELWLAAVELETQDVERRQRLPRRLRQMLSPVMPLEWLATANLAYGEERVPWELKPAPWVSLRRDWVAAHLPGWRERLPWEIGLQGIWPQAFAGRYAGGLEKGLRTAIREGISSEILEVDAKTHFDLMEIEMGFRAWLGARERYELLKAAFQGREGESLVAESASLADVQQ